MKYGKLTPHDIERLKNIAGPERFAAGRDISADYGRDELCAVSVMPDVLLRVKTTEEVSEIMKLANARRVPVTVRGAGTGLVGGATPVHGGILIETALMNKILELDKANLTVTVQPGVLLMDLAAFVEENDFLYPPDPGEKSATAGGNISTNAGGMRAVKYGVTRDYVRGLTVVTPDGKIMKLGGKTVKNSSGYGLKDLIIGSEGTLAVITEAVLKLIPLPSVSVSLLVPFESMEAALEAVPAVIRAKTNPTAVEYMSRETILYAEEFLGKKFPDTRYPAYLLLTFDGNDKTAVENEYSKTADLCLKAGAADVYMVDTEERKKTVWNARGAFLEAIKASTTEMDECDVVVPRDKIAEYIRFTRALEREENIRLPSFGHAGDGNLHVYLCRDDIPAREWPEKMARAFEKLYSKAAEMGGLVSGEHGIGYAKKDYLRALCGEDQTELMRRVKLAFDPENILNPDKVVRL